MINNLSQLWDENWEIILAVVFIMSFLMAFIFGTVCLNSIEFKSH